MRFDITKTLATLFKLAVICFVVGWLLVQFDISPEDIFDNFGENVRKIYDMARRAIEWGSGYIVIGAVIVLPLWLISVVINLLKGRRRNQQD